MSSSRHVLEALSKRCTGPKGFCSASRGSRHGTTTGRAARDAAVYPFQLCKAILVGLHKQLKAEGRLTQGVFGIQALWEADPFDGEWVEYVDVRTGERVSLLEYEKLDELFQVSHGRDGTYRDGVTGQELKPELVKAARQEEMEFFRDKKVWVKRPRGEARRVSGKYPISVK